MANEGPAAPGHWVQQDGSGDRKQTGLGDLGTQVGKLPRGSGERRLLSLQAAFTLLISFVQQIACTFWFHLDL